MKALGSALALILVCEPLAAGDKAPKVQENSIGMKLVRIEPGSFLMGTGDAAPASRAEWALRDADEAPAHRVHIKNAFHLGIHEVTNVQFEQFDPEHKKLRGKHGATKADDEPVTFVTWQQA